MEPGRCRDVRFTLGLSLAALLPRLHVALAWAREPVWDGHYYDFGAARIASGQGYSDTLTVAGQSVWHPWCHYPVGYSGFLGGLYAVFGADPRVATVANAVLGAVIVALVHRIALEMMSPWRARLAAVVCAVHPGMILFSGLVMTELLAAMLPLLALWWALAQRDHAVRGALGAGGVMGLATLVHPQTILLVPGLYWAFRTRSWKQGALATALAIATALAVVAPWTYRNCRVMDGCAFVSTNGGWNLAIGSFPRATGRFETLRASDGCRVVSGQVQQDRCWAGLAMHWIRSEPVRWLSLAPRKMAFLFDHESYAVEYLREADPQAWPEPVRVRWRRGLTAFHGLLMSAALFGFVARPIGRRRDVLIEGLLLVACAGLLAYCWTREPATFYPLAIATVALGLVPRPSAPASGPVEAFILIKLIALMAVHVLFFGEDRYHITAVPVLCLLAAASLRAPKSVARALPWRA